MVVRFRFNNWFLKCKALVAVIIFLMVLRQFFKYSFMHIHADCTHKEPIDVVYTWVNGSDPKFIDDLNRFLNVNASSKVDSSKQRYDDKYELKFSLRSLEKHAPWVRHVYIVTNGQIPYWLDLNYEKVSLVSHEEIFPDAFDLPSFSSPAIESHLHRIPGLSKRFLYFNDDIFLGAPVYLEDFVSESKGFLIYLAWPIPMCATDCPWMYVADGQCDRTCYNPDCQMDGGDCENGENSFHDDVFTAASQEIMHAEYFEEDGDMLEPKPQKALFSSQNNVSSVHNPPMLSNYSNKVDSAANNRTTLLLNSFLSRNISDNLTHAVHEHNKKIMLLDKLYRKRRNKRKSLISFNSTLIDKVRKNTFDAYGSSLQHTNRIFNLKYGFKPRHVPAHVPVLIDRNVMSDLQSNFTKEFERTSRNRFRSADDMQFSLSYYYYVIHEKIQKSIAEIFDMFDSDESGTWSDREIRTILTKLYDLPLSYSIVDHFEYILANCSNRGKYADVSTPEFERYIDSKLPTISKEMVVNCPVLCDTLTQHFGQSPRFKYHIVKNAESHTVTFKMLNSNISEAVGHLDEIRHKTKKFVCLNDNLDDLKTSENELVKAVLYDFYLSLFPKPSKFELPADYKNRFVYLDDLNVWKDSHFKIKMCIYLFVFILCYITFCNVCKRRYLSNFVNKIFC